LRNASYTELGLDIIEIRRGEKEYFAALSEVLRENDILRLMKCEKIKELQKEKV
jgi:hypothetical protein